MFPLQFFLLLSLLQDTTDPSILHGRRVALEVSALLLPLPKYECCGWVEQTGTKKASICLEGLPLTRCSQTLFPVTQYFYIAHFYFWITSYWICQSASEKCRCRWTLDTVVACKKQPLYSKHFLCSIYYYSHIQLSKFKKCRAKLTIYNSSEHFGC